MTLGFRALTTANDGLFTRLLTYLLTCLLIDVSSLERFEHSAQRSEAKQKIIPNPLSFLFRSLSVAFRAAPSNSSNVGTRFRIRAE